MSVELLDQALLQDVSWPSLPATEPAAAFGQPKAAASAPATSSKTSSKSEMAYAHLRTSIAKGGMGPGFRLVLQTIADHLGISVVPVREAIRRLEAEGLVTYERNVGAKVAMVDANSYIHVMEALGVVEGAAIASTAPTLSTEKLRKATMLNELMRSLLDDFNPHAFTALNKQFHFLLFDSCPNEILLDMVSTGWSKLSMLRDSTFSFIPGRAHASVEEHTHIVNLISSQASPLDIEIAVREHRLATVRAYCSMREKSHDLTSDPSP